MPTQIFLGADHRGFQLKQKLKSWLESQEYVVTDCGNHELNPDDDYPDFALEVAKRTTRQPGSIGVVLCGSGVGASVMANKVAGIRASLVMRSDQAQHARERDNLNVISLAADYLSLAPAQEILHAFLTTSFKNHDRDSRRLTKITDYEALS